MTEPLLAGGVILVENEDASFGDSLRREARKDEVIPALLCVIEDLQDRVLRLEQWRGFP